ncbi:restriction endonuclease subunit S [Alistipes putredinis]|uniref:restriction endonuclease subunit S n=1 Tax=Alistipes putredinis TaxID=28117 RepID=UPI00402943F5
MIHTWKKYKLSEIGSVVGGATPSTTVDAYYNGDIPWLTPKDLSNFHERYIERGERNITKSGLNSCSAQLLPAGSVLFSSRAPIGYVAIAKNPIATNQGFKSIIPNPEKVDSLFLYYLLKYNKDNIEAMGSGTTFKEVSGATMKNIEVYLPEDLDEQRRIAGILGSLDDKIELNRRINANLEAQAQALFRSWFVDFEPFRDGPFVDSELGKIPQGWKVGTINEIIQILSGYAFKSDTFTEAGPYRLITIKNVQDGSLNIDGAAYLSEIPDKMPQHCHLAIGDILLSLTGNVGRVCIVDRDGLLLNQRVAKLQPKDKRNTFFTYALFRQDSFKQYLIQIAKGTAQLNLSPVETSDTKIVLPNQDILLQFGEIGQPLFDNIVSNCKEIITLSALRDTLLPKLIAGEIAIE